MRIRAHNNLNDVIDAEVTRVVVYDDFDNPISLAIKHGKNWIYVSNVTDPDFQSYLLNCGIDKTVIVETIDKT